MLRRNSPQQGHCQRHGQTFVDPALEKPFCSEHLAAPARHRAFNRLIQHLNALTKAQNVHAASDVHAIGGGDRENAANAEALLLRGGQCLMGAQGCVGGVVAQRGRRGEWGDIGDGAIAAKYSENLQRK